LTSVAYSGYVFRQNTVSRGGPCVSAIPPNIVTELLANWHAGDNEALCALLPLVYDELRRSAHRYLRKERPGHTLQSTALVHEAYLRLEKQGAMRFQNREQFLAICSELMRQILVEYARARKAAKRDGGIRITLDDVLGAKARGLDVIALDDALNDLDKLDSHQARIVVMRYFGGLSIEETAQALGISPATVKRHWETARLWLRREMSRASRS
jgi:RNA polymerase sigma factor (TIGR02999 family)